VLNRSTREERSKPQKTVGGAPLASIYVAAVARQGAEQPPEALLTATENARGRHIATAVDRAATAAGAAARVIKAAGHTAAGDCLWQTDADRQTLEAVDVAQPLEGRRQGGAVRPVPRTAGQS